MLPALGTYEITQLIMVLLFSGFGIYYITDDFVRSKFQTRYEIEFIHRHRNFINERRIIGAGDDDFIKLTFQEREMNRLSDLCSKFRSKWFPLYYIHRLNVDMFIPHVQIHLIGFRRVDDESLRKLRIQVIRCTESYALIEAGDGLSGYVLERDELVADVDLFHIYAKFNYREKSPSRAAEEHESMLLT